MTEPLDGQWCGTEMWRIPLKAYRPCGGQLDVVRRKEGELIVTYLQCRFCGALTKTREEKA